MIIKYSTSLVLLLLAGAVFVACQDTLVDNATTTSPFDESNLVEAKLTVTVEELNVYTDDTRTAEPSDNKETATEDEKQVADIWVFQYGMSGSLLIEPRYYTALESYNSSTDTWDVVLKEEESYIYVVTNTQNDLWVSDYTNFSTVEELKKQALINPDPIIFGDDHEENLIPMGGMTEDVVKPSGETIVVPVTRMYAKLKIKVKLADILDEYYDAVEVSYVNVTEIPHYCRVGSLAEEETATEGAVEFPTGTEFTSKAFVGLEDDYDDDTSYPYVIYVPETLRGESENTKELPEEKGSSDSTPTNAIAITARIVFWAKGEEQAVIYTVYPGGNNYNNYNIRRNNVYRITMNIGYPEEETPEPSANCIAGFAGETLVFYPYYRVEIGGQDTENSDYYKFSNYLDPTDATGEKVISYLKIIWQTENCIGNNTNGDLVEIRQNTAQDNPIYQYKIYVKTSSEGNALIGAYNTSGDIIWSWHIWVRATTQKDPTNIANAVTYYTYYWDEDGIDPTSHSRVLGYPVMNCNIGSLDDEPKSTEWDDYTRTYGTLYQWGRKDPFPPCKHQGKLAQVYNYDEENAHVVVYDNEMVKIDLTDNTGMPLEGGNKYKEFNTILTTSLEQTFQAGIDYSIKHPTTFIAAANQLTSSSSSFDNPTNYINQGDWMPIQEDYLWGGTSDYTKKYDAYTMETNHLQASIRDNYGPNKTIFDPCPYGWRTAPGDIWLGFTSTGKNVTSIANINCSETTTAEALAQMGYHFYMQGWKNGQTSFFPTQGSRIASGQAFYGGICGNYHNATADEISDVYLSGTIYEKACKRVDILHVHARTESEVKVNIFEDQLVYYNRAVAGPVRCVRETK